MDRSNINWHTARSFCNDAHNELQADYIIAFPSCGDHRDIHSFPTRRSSDPARARLSGSASSSRNAWLTAVPTTPCSSRSEEHTSELQSHVNLVCRLLLEKKKYHCQSSIQRQ